MIKVQNMGSFAFPTTILDDMNLSMYEKLTCISLWCLKSEGDTSPTISKIGSYVGASDATIVKTVKSLEEKGWIKRTPFKKERGFGFEYTLFESPEYPEIEVMQATLANRKSNDLTAPRRKQFGRNVR